jgi:hypothetical protein
LDDNAPNLSEVYKLQSNDLRNKSRIEIHKDNGKHGIKFTINKMIPEFNKGAEKCDLNSLTPKSVPAGAKKILFGRYVLNIYVGIV